ncbi:MAG: hypothetical protein AB7E21_14335 [Pseudodonghicola sp.]|jgi:hypothetical protein|uniref:hypothetical protein n=1 Tax=Pseudodonghicola sp. TaxID=1969463 RepID=UPI003A97E2F0
MTKLFRPLPFAVLTFGILLHAHGDLILAGGGSPLAAAVFLFSALPYVIALIALRRHPESWIAALAAGAVLLMMDLAVFRSVLISPALSAGLLALLVEPLVNLLLALPFGWYLGRVMARG